MSVLVGLVGRAGVLHSEPLIKKRLNLETQKGCMKPLPASLL
jgi:hypothetical protein